MTAQRAHLSASIQTRGRFLTVEGVIGGRIKYTVWSRVVTYFGLAPVKGAVYVHQTGISPVSLVELIRRESGHDAEALMGYQGSHSAYPYTRSVPYTGPTEGPLVALPTVDLSRGEL